MAPSVKEVEEILEVVNILAPAGVKLVKDLATSLVGKTDAEILGEADAIDQDTIQTADAELSKLDNPVE